MNRYLPGVLVLAIGLAISIALPFFTATRIDDDPTPNRNRRAPSFSMTAALEKVPDPHDLPRFENVAETNSEMSGAVLQDRDGFIWVGTYGGGLQRYDGRELAPFHPARGQLSGKNVTALHEDENGLIWIGSLAGLDRYDKETGTISPAPVATGGEIGGIWTICALDGDLWLGTNGRGLLRYDPAAATLQSHRHDDSDPESLVHDNLYRVLPARDGGLWLGSFGGGVAHFDPRSGRCDRRIDTTSGLASNQIWSLHEDGRGRLWIGTQEGLYRLGLADGTLQEYGHDLADPETIGGRVITGIREDADGGIWLTSFNGPSVLGRLDPASGVVQRFAEDCGLGRRGARCVFEDDAGLFWVVTMGGLAKYDENSLGFQITQIGSGLLPMYEDLDGAMWLGTMDGLRVIRRRGGKLDEVREPLLHQSLTSALNEDRKGRFWVATFGGALQLYDRATDRIVGSFQNDPSDATSLPASNCIRRILPDRADDDLLWLATQGGGLTAFDCSSGKARRFQHDPADPESVSNDTASYGALLQDADGSLWFGTDDGLNHVDPGSGKSHRYQAESRPDGLRSSVIQALHRDRQGRLWVATAAGLHRLDDAEKGRFTVFGVAEGLPDDVVLGILEDQDRLWLSTPRGVASFDPDGKLPIEIYGREEGLQADGFLLTSFYRTRDGELWFGGARGASHFKPQAARATSYLPPVALTALRQNGKDLALERDVCQVTKIDLSWPANSFEFEVAALGFSRPGSNRYRYKLEGLDDDWYESDRGFGRYSGLDGGEYLLRIRAAGAAGIFGSEGVDLRVRVEPPFWRARWFTTSILVLITLLVSGAVHHNGLLRAEIRQRREAEQRRDAAEARLREATRAEALGRLSAGVAHDFNNLLMVVLGEIDLLRDKLPRALALELDEDCRAIETAALRGADLTAQLLAFSSRRATSPRNIDLNSVVSASRRLFERVLGEDVKVEYRLARSRLVVLADPGKLGQVLMNLVVNARQAMAEGGRLTITTRRHELPAGDQYAEVSVADSGHGIPAEVIDRIFDPYFTTKRQGEGTGLGLAIVREVIEQHDGFVDVSSSPGEGTVFRAYLPLVDAEEDEQAPVRIERRRRESGGRILLVEDDLHVRRMFAAFLDRAGWEVVSAAGGGEALTLWQAERRGFRAVVTDIVLPEMGGDELVDRFRADDGDLPLILVSGYAPDRIRIDPRGGGPWRLLSKPLRPSQLLEALEDLLGTESSDQAS
ncbi:MAG: response regulator [Planctomycetes bacterium]|nr:response regulator [Planctomycetota bacterium]